MPLLIRGHSPASAAFQGKEVEKIYYNENLVWKSFPKKRALENMSWEDISLVCRAGLASEYWQPGDTKCLVDDDSSIQLQIIGIDHDSVTDSAAYGQKKAGLTLQMLQVPSSLNTHMNTTNYTNTSWYHSTSHYRSIIRSTLFPNYLNSSIPEALKSVLVPVNKDYIMAGSGDEGVVSDTLFLPSRNEVFGNITSGYGREGTQYAYFAQGGSKIRTLISGSAVIWWTRSPTGSSGKFYLVNASGAQSTTWSSEMAYAPPCMCI